MAQRSVAHMVLDKAMILIAHRGNIHGRKEERENTKTYALEALERGYNVELDVWFTGKLWLGHRKPKEQIELEFFVGNSVRPGSKDKDGNSKKSKEITYVFVKTN